MLEKTGPANLSHMMHLMAVLVRSCHTEASPTLGPPPNSILNASAPALAPGAPGALGQYCDLLLKLPEPDQSLLLQGILKVCL